MERGPDHPKVRASAYTVRWSAAVWSPTRTLRSEPRHVAAHALVTRAFQILRPAHDIGCAAPAGGAWAAAQLGQEPPARRSISVIRRKRNSRSGPLVANSAARRYAVIASASRPSRRSRSARVACSRW